MTTSVQNTVIDDSCLLQATQVRIVKKKSNYDIKYSLASAASDGPCPHGWRPKLKFRAHAENGVSSPQIFHCNLCRLDPGWGSAHTPL